MRQAIAERFIPKSCACYSHHYSKHKVIEKARRRAALAVFDSEQLGKYNLVTRSLNLVLTSDFPSTANEAVLNCMRAISPHPRVAWIPPLTPTGRERFSAARDLFASNGFPDLEYCDIDEEPDEAQLAHLDRYDVLYLTGGDPIGFRRSILRSRLAARLPEYLAAGRLIVAASGGSMQFTKNVSLFRLLTETLDDVIATRAEYEALGVVDYEILPHMNRLDPSFLETVQRYSERLGQEVIALADGAAVLHTSLDEYRCIGQVMRIRNGIWKETT